MSQRGRGYGVLTALPSYTAAVAELPLSAALAEDAGGAVVVVPGAGDWWQGMLAARAGGASAVVVADPGMLPRETLESRPWPGGIPVIVERPRLRPDVVADAVRARRGSPARIITVECAAPAAALDTAIRDGFGWQRSLAREQLTLRSWIATAQGRMALLDSEASSGGSVPATLAATVMGGGCAGGLLQVMALGEVRTEVTVDEPAALMRLATSTEDGTLRARDRYESSARLALRRAFDACALGGAVADLDGLLEDMALTWALAAK